MSEKEYTDSSGQGWVLNLAELPIGETIRLRRKELGLSQLELGEKINFTKSGISKIERVGFMSNKTRKKLSEVLNMEIPLKNVVIRKATLKDQISSLQSENERLKKESEVFQKGFDGMKEALSIAMKEIERLKSSVSNERARELLREVVMRSQLSFPENNQDDNWFNEGLKPELYPRIVKELELGLGDDDILPMPEPDFLPNGEDKKERFECNCTPDETTGWIETKCCNICGKHVKEDSLNKE